MQRYVVTGFDEGYWSRWGLSWFISLRELARYDGNILVVDHGLTPATKSTVTALGGTILPSPDGPDFRYKSYRAVAELAGTEPGIYAYWDADVFFQTDISEVFDLAADKLVVASRNPGFLAGPSHYWSLIQDVSSFITLAQQAVTGQAVYDCLLAHFPRFLRTADDGWNHVDMPTLKDQDGRLVHKERVVPVVHPSGAIKNFLPGRHMLFWERHPDLLEKYSRRRDSRKLVLRSK